MILNRASGRPKAIIVGGSMAGLFCALLLRKSGWDVDVFERIGSELSGRGAGIVTHGELFEILRTINERERVSMLLVEQNAAMALDLADQAYLIETGRIVLSGSAQEVKSNDGVRKSYLGY